uniref:Zinc finger BED domain-containing protein RICESLEEPER 2-like n=1 Tax=Cannabis sativa TaxID=3483 RepID=A0A803QGL1_CANSA
MASTGHKPRSLDEEEDPGIEHISNEETGAQDANESTTLTSTTFPTTDDGTEENGLKRKSNLSSWVWEPFTKAKITCKKSVSLDVPTRWNSTYLMLEAAEKYQKAFERMEMHDVGYVMEFCTSKEKACPNESDWDSARLFIKFLKIFNDSTLRFSGSNYVTSNHFLDRVSFIHSRLEFWCGNKSNYKLNIMAESMKIKFDKYWGEIKKLNPLLLVAILLDPRYREPYLKICFEMMCGDSLEASRHANNVRKILDQMYKEYSIIDSNGGIHHSSSTHLGEESRDEHENDDDYTWFDQQRKEKLKAVEHSENKTEVDKYFIEACENFENPDFDVLKWWKHNVGRFKILSKIAQDIFAILRLMLHRNQHFHRVSH